MPVNLGKKVKWSPAACICEIALYCTEKTGSLGRWMRDYQLGNNPVLHTGMQNRAPYSAVVHAAKLYDNAMSSDYPL